MQSSKKESWSLVILWSESYRKRLKGITMEAGIFSMASLEDRKTWTSGKKLWQSGSISNPYSISNVLSKSSRKDFLREAKQVGDQMIMQNRLTRDCKFSIIRPSQLSISTISKTRSKK